ncbi:hypothetical protein [Flavobacterium sp. 25HG05S-40]|uniref:hypothetical protein n=1 Tax=Flavobacterium sp. 25HG05S-40 TaxID=3458682 RepID=UPI004044D282
MKEFMGYVMTVNPFDFGWISAMGAIVFTYLMVAVLAMCHFKLLAFMGLRFAFYKLKFKYNKKRQAKLSVRNLII